MLPAASLSGSVDPRLHELFRWSTRFLLEPTALPLRHFFLHMVLHFLHAVGHWFLLAHPVRTTGLGTAAAPAAKKTYAKRDGSGYDSDQEITAYYDVDAVAHGNPVTESYLNQLVVNAAIEFIIVS
jgi:hypothetical protein